MVRGRRRRRRRRCTPSPCACSAADYVLWRSADGTVVGAPDRCPHREAPLSAGAVTDGDLSCAYHGWSFGDGGRCVAIPSADPATPIPPTAHLPAVQVEERYGLVWLCPGEPTGTIPVVSHDDDPAFRRINTGVDVWKTSATRMTDNFLDFSHFPWVHTGTFGRGQDPRIPHLDLEELPDGWFGYAYEVDADNPDEAKVTSTSDEPTVHRWMTTGFHLPFTVRSTIRYADGLEHILLLVSTPIDDVTSYFTFVVWRNDDFSVDRPRGRGLRPCHRRRGQGHARKGPGRAAPRPDRCRQRPGRQGLGRMASPPHHPHGCLTQCTPSTPMEHDR